MGKKAIIGLGGNVGDRESLLESAIEACGLLGNILKASSIYETAAWGGVAKNSFLNQVIELETDLDPLTLLQKMQQIENDLGRQRSVHWGDRTMDLDLLFFENEQIQNSALVIPHPAISSRRFVLEPLCEILPDLVHPVSLKPISELLLKCPDSEKVNLFKRR